MKYYVMILENGSMELDGPYKTKKERDAVALAVMEDLDSDNGDMVFKLDSEGDAQVFNYSEEQLGLESDEDDDDSDEDEEDDEEF